MVVSGGLIQDPQNFDFWISLNVQFKKIILVALAAMELNFY
jgi:hypothetical protein